jgi:hypothetical protein
VYLHHRASYPEWLNQAGKVVTGCRPLVDGHRLLEVVGWWLISGHSDI